MAFLNKKGFAFTMDVALALIIASLILALANFYVGRISVDIYPTLQISRSGSDMITILDNLDYLNPPVASNIQTELEKILPPYYDIQITGDGTSDCSFQVGNEPPDDRLIMTGERYFVIKDSDYKYCIARYKIWQK